MLQQQLWLRPGQALRVYSQDARGTFSRQAARRRTLKETMMAPSEGTAISAGTVPYGTTNFREAFRKCFINTCVPELWSVFGSQVRIRIRIR